MQRHRILIVEDDERIGSSLLRALEGSGYDAVWEQTGQGGLASIEAIEPDLVLLDLGLPDADGVDVCSRIQEAAPRVDVIMLTARDSELDVVVGLDSGAVDYVVKPFKLAELLARIRAQFRRRGEIANAAKQTIGQLVLDRASRQVWLSGQEIELRPKEFDLLARLAEDLGRVVLREELMSDVWDSHWYGSTKTLDFHVAALRKKLDKSGEPSRISTVRGVGYRLEQL